MSRYTILKDPEGVEVAGVEITSVAELNRALEENATRVSRAEANLKMIMAATPKDLFPEDEQGSTLEKLSFAIDTALEEYEDAISERTRLYVIELNSESINK